MVEEDFGEATIVYDHPEDGTVETTIQNEHVAYFQDHWILKRGEDEEGRDRIRRIPKERVHYVDRSVEAFEEEVATLKDQVQSVADDLRSKFLGGDDDRDRRSEPQTIDVEAETDDRDESRGGDDGV